MYDGEDHDSVSCVRSDDEEKNLEYVIVDIHICVKLYIAIHLVAAYYTTPKYCTI